MLNTLYISGRYQPAVFLVNTEKPSVFFGIAVAEGAGAVGGAVVHKDYLKVCEGLGQNAVKTLRQIGFYVVYGYDDG